MDRYSRPNLIIERANSGVQTYLAQVYGWMTCGLLLTAFVAWYASRSEAIVTLLFSSGHIAFLGLCVVELGLVFLLSRAINNMSGSVATGMFMLYSALNGLTLSFIFLRYTNSSIASTFAVTAGTFGIMSLYGYTTKRDLSRMGSLLFMAVIGLVLASLVNMFLKSAPLTWVITYAGVLIFVGLTAYDTQKLKEFGAQISSNDSDSFRKYSIMGALDLYLDFINLFLYLLRILGDRR
jgi:FtsH-binding integral membrane protein